MMRSRRSPARALAPLALLLALQPAEDVDAATKVLLRIESTPQGALVSVSSPAAKEGAPVTIAGVTPFEKTFTFRKEARLDLILEKRGYAPHQIEITPTSTLVSAPLEKLALAGDSGAHVLPQSGPLLLVPAEIDVIKRGFSREGVDPVASRAAAVAVDASLRASLGGTFEVDTVPVNEETRAALGSLWRDARTAMQLTDPIRLPYLAQALRLETRSSRSAAAALGRALPRAHLLLVSGKQVRDTAGMKLGQLAVLAAGTACSYGSGYARAMERGDSFFVYNVHTPNFTSGLTLKAVLVDATTGEVVWVNRGNWKAVPFDRAEAVGPVVLELLAGLLR